MSIILRTVSNYLVILQVVFASIDMWNNFIVTFKDEPILDDMIRMIGGYCTLWTYWSQYMLGIVPWICINQYRYHRHGFIFNRYVNKNRKPYYRKIAYLGSLFFVLVPITIILSTITFEDRLGKYTSSVWLAVVRDWGSTYP